MDKLQRVLASGVLDVLRERAHVVVSPARRDALRDELEEIIVPALEWLEPHLSSERAEAIKGTRHLGEILEAGRVRELMQRLAAQLADRLHESDHVDDIYATDAVIRRDAHRSLRDLLIDYMRGELVVERLNDEAAVLVPLLELGYLVSEVARRLDLDVLRDALERGAAAVGGRLLHVTEGRVGQFDLLGGAEAGRLALEEAITHELVGLIEAELVELPCVEDTLELEGGSARSPEFESAFERALLRTRAEYDCAAQCVAIDDHTVIATLTPLSAHSAEHASDAFAAFVQALEEELATPARNAALADDPPHEVKLPSSRRRAAPTSDDKTPPRSEPRGRGIAPRAATSSTRSTQPASSKGNRKRAT